MSMKAFVGLAFSPDDAIENAGVKCDAWIASEKQLGKNIIEDKRDVLNPQRETATSNLWIATLTINYHV